MRLLRIRKRRVLLFLSVVGPGIITASVDQDAGGIATYSVAGAHYGYTLLWSLPLIILSLIIVQEMGSRMGVVTGKGLADLIRGQFGVRITLLVMALLVVTNLANTVSEFAGIAASLEIFGVSRYLAVPAAVLVVSGLVIKGTYTAVERVFLAASTFYFVYAVSAVLAEPPWPVVLRETLRPSFRFDRGYLVMLITLVGTTIAPWMQFYLQSSIVDKGIRIKAYRYTRWDVILGSVAAGLIAAAIIIACGATLFARGIPVQDAAAAAVALEPVAGRYATILFALGLLNASLFSAAILPLSTAYAVCEAFGWETGINRTPREAPSFFAIYLTMVVGGALPVLWPTAPLLSIMILSQTLNGLLLQEIIHRGDLAEQRTDMWVTGFRHEPPASETQ